MSEDNVITSDGRLILRNTTKLNTKANPTPTNPPTRLARAVLQGDLVTGFSREDDSNEYLQAKDQKAGFVKSPSRTVSKDGSSNAGATVVNKTEANPPVDRNKVELVKKPIPKFVEIDYDDDFQNKVIRSPLKYPDSGEHEDEDFNLDDYDFDINHDEYASGGKPLEPRLKNKHLLEQQHLGPEAERPPPPKSVVPAPLPTKIITKREQDRKLTNQVAHKLKEDYYDDISTTKAPEPKTNSDEDSSEDDSKEVLHKTARIARSSFNNNIASINKANDKSQAQMKMMSFLPMFPTHQAAVEEDKDD